MHIYFDLDETVIDEEGDEVRPGVRSLFEKLLIDGHQLSLWSASTEERGTELLAQHGLSGIFRNTVFREDYDPNREGYGKDIRYRCGDLLVDDSPAQVEFVQSLGKKGLLVPSFRTELKKHWIDDSLDIYNQITCMSEESQSSFSQSKKCPQSRGLR